MQKRDSSFSVHIESNCLPVLVDASHFILIIDFSRKSWYLYILDVVSFISLAVWSRLQKNLNVSLKVKQWLVMRINLVIVRSLSLQWIDQLFQWK
jgi:hypothetical protein